MGRGPRGSQLAQSQPYEPGVRAGMANTSHFPRCTELFLFLIEKWRQKLGRCSLSAHTAHYGDVLTEHYRANKPMGHVGMHPFSAQPQLPHSGAACCPRSNNASKPQISLSHSGTSTFQNIHLPWVSGRSERPKKSGTVHSAARSSLLPRAG